MLTDLSKRIFACLLTVAPATASAFDWQAKVREVAIGAAEVVEKTRRCLDKGTSSACGFTGSDIGNIIGETREDAKIIADTYAAFAKAGIPVAKETLKAFVEWLHTPEGKEALKKIDPRLIPPTPEITDNWIGVFGRWVDESGEKFQNLVNAFKKYLDDHPTAFDETPTPAPNLP